jgi:hypothetical protein
VTQGQYPIKKCDPRDVTDLFFRQKKLLFYAPEALECLAVEVESVATLRKLFPQDYKREP